MQLSTLHQGFFCLGLEYYDKVYDDHSHAHYVSEVFAATFRLIPFVTQIRNILFLTTQEMVVNPYKVPQYDTKTLRRTIEKSICKNCSFQ